jgi:hypothetical protein
MAWAKAGSTTLGSAGDDLDITSMTANDFNQFIIHSIASGSMKHNFRFDDNSGSVYARGRSYNGAGKSNASSQAQIEYHGDGALDRFEVIYGVNLTGEEKLQIHHCVTQGGSGSGTAPDRSLAVSKAVITDQYTRVDCFNDAAGSFDTGSNITVLGSGMTPAAAIPALDDVQDGSVFVDKVNAYRYWFSETLAPTFEDDFSSDDWTDTGSNIGVNTSTNVLDFNGVTDGSNSASVYDLGAGNVSDTAWVCRFKYTLTSWTNPSGATNYIFIGLSDLPQTTASSASQDFIGFQTTRNLNGSIGRELLDTDGALVLGASGVAMDNPSIGTQWIEIVRTSATQATIKVFSDSTYSTQVGNTVTATVASGTSGLRYIKVMNRDNVSNGGTLIGSIDDVEFYNGVTTVTPATWTMQLSLADLKAYWKMGEIGGNLVNHATSIGSTASMSADLVSSGTVNRGTAGHVSGVDSIGFPTYDADGNKVTANNSASDYGFMNKAAAKFTLCFWAKNESYNSTVDLWGFGGNGSGTDIMFRNKSSGFTIWLSGTEYTSFTHNVGDNNWHFYMLSWDEDGGSDNVQFQLDGTKQTATVTTSNTSDASNPLIIGDVSGNEPEMDIQEFSLWNRILSDVEIAHIYNAGAGRQL